MPCSETSIVQFQWPIYLVIWRAGSRGSGSGCMNLGQMSRGEQCCLCHRYREVVGQSWGRRSGRCHLQAGVTYSHRAATRPTLLLNLANMDKKSFKKYSDKWKLEHFISTITGKTTVHLLRKIAWYDQKTPQQLQMDLEIVFVACLRKVFASCQNSLAAGAPFSD